MAQGPDLTGPTVTIVTPAEGAAFTQGQPVNASYSCSDPSGVKDCVGHGRRRRRDQHLGGGQLHLHGRRPRHARQPDDGHAQLLGPAGHRADRWRDAADAGPHARHAGGFSPFIPGLAREYSTTMTASVTSTAENVSLSVADPARPPRAASSTGRSRSPRRCRVASSTLQDPAANPPLTVRPAGPVGGSASPLQLLTYNTPVGLDVATLTFKQSIGRTEALRTGGYSKTLTFTLSTTNP